jgi:hypothetical protein
VAGREHDEEGAHEGRPGDDREEGNAAHRETQWAHTNSSRTPNATP